MKQQKLVFLFILLFSYSCATYSSFYGDNNLKPSEIDLVLVVIDAKDDNSVLKRNKFLQSRVIEQVCVLLKEKGINAISGLGKNLERDQCSHLLVLQSQGTTTSKGYHQSAPMTMDSYRSGIDSQGNAYTYSVPQTIGGGGNTYKTRDIQAVAILFEKTTDGQYNEIAQSYSGGDGMSLIERSINMSEAGQVLGYQKRLDSVYATVFVAAADELFTTEK